MGMMANEEFNTMNVPGGFGGGFGGGGLWAIIVVILGFWFLTKDDRNNNCNGGHGHLGGYPYPLPNMVADEKVYQADQHITDKLAFVDRDVIEQGCQTRTAEALEAEKTRALIVHEAERAQDKYDAQLQATIVEKNQEILTLKSEMNQNAGFSKLEAMIGGVTAHINNELTKIYDHIPHTPPFVPAGFYGYPESMPHC